MAGWRRQPGRWRTRTVGWHRWNSAGRNRHCQSGRAGCRAPTTEAGIARRVQRPKIPRRACSNQCESCRNRQQSRARRRHCWTTTHYRKATAKRNPPRWRPGWGGHSTSKRHHGRSDGARSHPWCSPASDCRAQGRARPSRRSGRNLSRHRTTFISSPP